MLLFLCLLLGFLPHHNLSSPDLGEIRKQFVASVEDAKQAHNLYSKLSKSASVADPLYLGYFGATEALLAKHSWNPYKKLDYLAKSQKTLQNAIAKLPNNIELRFLRFSIQHYLPSFLGQSKNLEEDMAVLLKELISRNIQQNEMQLARNVAQFLIESKRCSAHQVASLVKFMEETK